MFASHVISFEESNTSSTWIRLSEANHFQPCFKVPTHNIEIRKCHGDFMDIQNALKISASLRGQLLETTEDAKLAQALGIVEAFPFLIDLHTLGLVVISYKRSNEESLCALLCAFLTTNASFSDFVHVSIYVSATVS